MLMFGLSLISSFLLCALRTINSIKQFLSSSSSYHITIIFTSDHINLISGLMCNMRWRNMLSNWMTQCIWWRKLPYDRLKQNRHLRYYSMFLLFLLRRSYRLTHYYNQIGVHSVFGRTYRSFNELKSNVYPLRCVCTLYIIVSRPLREFCDFLYYINVVMWLKSIS